MLEEIRCSVLKALPEIIIVSYETPEKRIFQGALLNVSNPWVYSFDFKFDLVMEIASEF